MESVTYVINSHFVRHNRGHKHFKNKNSALYFVKSCLKAYFKAKYLPVSFGTLLSYSRRETHDLKKQWEQDKAHCKFDSVSLLLAFVSEV
jgi:hypothetical protein